jgi:hypothetical protein
MVKETKFFRKQAAKAQRAAEQTLDPGVSAGLRALALAYRSQADALKKSKNAAKKKRH